MCWRLFGGRKVLGLVGHDGKSKKYAIVGRILRRDECSYKGSKIRSTGRRGRELPNERGNIKY